MDLQTLRGEFRRLAGDRSVPPIWPTADVDRWFNDAVAEAATRAKLINDRNTPAVVEIDLLVDQREYLLHPSILDIESAELLRPNSNGKRCAMCVSTHDEIQWEIQHRPNLSGWAKHYSFYDQSEASPRLVLDRKPGELGGKIYLSVFRLPLEPMVDPTDEPEIHPRHHSGLVDWVLHRAFSTRDIEGDASARSQRHEATFAARFGERQDANVQRKHMRHRATVVRPIRFG